MNFFFQSPKTVVRKAINESHSIASLEAVSLSSDDTARDAGKDDEILTTQMTTEQLRAQTKESRVYDKQKKKEKRLKKKLKDMTENPPETRVNRAQKRRRELMIQRKVSEECRKEHDTILRCLGVDEDGYCLRHDDQLIRSGKIPYRFGKIQTCRSCAFGEKAGEKHRHHKSHNPFRRNKKHSATVAYDVGALSKSKSSRSLGGSDDESEGFELERKPSNMSRTEFDCIADESWKGDVFLRVTQVLVWENNKVPLKCHPQYAKYFRMLRHGVSQEEIILACESEGIDHLVLNLNPDKSFEEQLDGLSTHVQERLRYTASNQAFAKQTPEEITEEVFQAYSTHREIFQKHQNEDLVTPSSNQIKLSGFNPEQKRKRLRLKKKLNRILRSQGSRRSMELELQHSSSHSRDEDSEIDDESESHEFSDHFAYSKASPKSSPRVIPVVGMPKVVERRGRRSDSHLVSPRNNQMRSATHVNRNTPRTTSSSIDRSLKIEDTHDSSDTIPASVKNSLQAPDLDRSVEKSLMSKNRMDMADYESVVEELKTTKAEYESILTELKFTKESLFQANYLLSNAKKQIEHLQKEGKEKDKRIKKLIRSNLQMPSPIVGDAKEPPGDLISEFDKTNPEEIQVPKVSGPELHHSISSRAHSQERMRTDPLDPPDPPLLNARATSIDSIREKQRKKRELEGRLRRSKEGLANGNIQMTLPSDEKEEFL